MTPWLFTLWACGDGDGTVPPTDTTAPTDTTDTDTDTTVPPPPPPTPTDTATTDGTDGTIPSGFVYPTAQDFSGFGWSDAFALARAEIEANYTVADHKGVDLVALGDTAAAAIATAETTVDLGAYYLAVRRYLWAIPDGRVSLVGPDQGQLAAHIAGSYGLAIDTLDDGAVVVSAILPGGSAEHASVTVGTTVTTWNGEPIAGALAGVELIWGERPPATDVGRARLAERLLVRGPVDATAELGFLDAGGVPRTAELHAENDGYAGLELTSPIDLVDPAELVTFTLLPSGFGFLHLQLAAAATVDTAEDAFRNFQNFGVPGAIVDFRGCDGDDQTAGAAMVSGLFTVPTFYMYQAWTNRATGQLERDPDNPLDLLEIVAPPFTYDGPVVALVNHGTSGACEPMVAAIAALPRTAVVGFDGTHGSPGLDTVRIDLPEGIAAIVPVGAPLAANETIAWTSRADGTGGIAPTSPIARTLDAVLALRAGDSVEIEAAEAVLSTL